MRGNKVPICVRVKGAKMASTEAIAPSAASQVKNMRQLNFGAVTGLLEMPIPKLPIEPAIPTPSQIQPA